MTIPHIDPQEIAKLGKAFLQERLQDPKETEALRNRVSSEITGYTAQRNAVVENLIKNDGLFSGKHDHDITLGGASTAALEAVNRMIGNITLNTPRQTRSFSR